jgi:NAD(P)-dependent dehydrogenase (short-subunit alcohol dehydrogenase family)
LILLHKIPSQPLVYFCTEWYINQNQDDSGVEIMARLAGKKALITGGTTGIGFATAKRFLEEGAQVAISGQNHERSQEALSKLGNNAIGVLADLSLVHDVQTMVDRVRRDFGSLDILVANAGIVKPAPVNVVDESHINEQFDINFKGVFFTVQKALPILNNPASIVLNTSCLDEMGMPGMSIYSASKAAVRSLARSFSAELIGQGIRVNAVSPGPIETPIYSKLGMPAEEVQAMAEGLIGQIPMGRFGQADEVAKAVLFLASDDSSFMLGEEIVVDGGWSKV